MAVDFSSARYSTVVYSTVQDYGNYQQFVQPLVDTLLALAWGYGTREGY